LSDDPSHIFICFSSKDEPIAREVVAFLETEGLKCWISCRDVPAGRNYQETIVHALEAAQGIVFLFSKSSGTSGEILKELSLAGAIKAPVFPLRLAPISPTGALRYELATRQWIDIFPDQDKALRRLTETIQNALEAQATAEDEAPDASELEVTPAGVGSGARIAEAAQPAKKRPRAVRGPVVAAGSQEFEAIRALLARHIGPIAKVIVQKAAAEARTPEDLCERLAAHVSAPSDRAAFLRTARAQFAAKP
jgi:TIR domain